MNKQILPVVITILIFSGLIAGSILVQRRMETRRIAAPETTLSFNAPSEVDVGEEFNVQVLIDSGNNEITGAEIEVLYPADKLEALSFDLPPDPFFENTIIDGTYDNAQGRAYIVPNCEVTQDGPVPKSGEGILAVLKLKAIAPGGAEIVFGSGTQVAALNENEDVADQKLNHSLVIESGGVPTNTPIPTRTNTPIPTRIPRPTNTSTPWPTRTPEPDGCKPCPDGTKIDSRADYNCDGLVNEQDFAAWYDDWTSGSDLLYGDFNCDNLVDVQDFAQWYDEYN